MLKQFTLKLIFFSSNLSKLKNKIKLKLKKVHKFLNNPFDDEILKELV